MSDSNREAASPSDLTAAPRLWHALDVPEVVAALDVDLEHGLAGDLARRRALLFGPNSIEKSRRGRWLAVLGRQFTDLLIVILLVAAAAATIIGDASDAFAILLIVLLNAALGFAQEWKAERALAALNEELAPTCRVLRDGREASIAAVGLVPGDVVLLHTGDRVPADLRLFDVVELRLDESLLTGESDAVGKSSAPAAREAPPVERCGMAFSGTSVTHGHARGIVVATGMATELGTIAELTERAGDESTPLQRKLGTLGRQLGFAALLISAVLALLGWLAGRPPLQMAMTGVSLAVAIIPEGLPAVVTITLSLGARAMARRRALLRHLEAAETLGAATVICSDKTGTLTQNEMTVQHIWLPPRGVLTVSGVGYRPAGAFLLDGRPLRAPLPADLLALLESAATCNNAQLTEESGTWRRLGEPTEAALLVAARKANVAPAGPRVTEIPFDAERKRMAVLVDGPDGMVAHVKGAPDVILPRCARVVTRDGDRALASSDLDAAAEAVGAFAGRGLRTLALARRHLAAAAPRDAASLEEDLTLLGIMAITDPPRADVLRALQLTRSAGIRVMMLTGDASVTAQAVATRLGFRHFTTLTGREIDQADDARLTDALRGDVVFARTTPAQKLRIVELLQSLGHVVAMTGDGVNDAPALRQADIGVAMGKRGTEVAKGAADLVLTDDNFATIVTAIEEGRRELDNIRKFVGYLLSSNAGEVMAILLNVASGGPMILAPVQILWMNLVTDGPTAVALGTEPADADTMRRPPRDPESPVVDAPIGWRILIYSVYIGVMTFAVFVGYLRHDPLRAQTVAFTAIIVAEKINVFNFRSLHAPLGIRGLVSNPWVLVAVAAALTAQLAAVYLPPMQAMLHTVPLEGIDWAIIFALTVPLFLTSEIYKLTTNAGSQHAP